MPRRCTSQPCPSRVSGTVLYGSLLNHSEMSCCWDLPNGLPARFSLPFFCSSAPTRCRSFKVLILDMVDIIILDCHFLCLKPSVKAIPFLDKMANVLFEQSKKLPKKIFLNIVRFGVHSLTWLVFFFISTGCSVSLLLLRQTAQVLGWSSKIKSYIGITMLIQSYYWWCTTLSQLLFVSGYKSPL